MNKHRKFILGFGGALSLAGILVSCGGGGAASSSSSASSSGSNSSSTSGSSTSSSSSSSKEDKVSFSFWHTFGQKNVEALNSKKEAFAKLVKENEGVDVDITLTYKGGYSDIQEVISKGFAAGNVPTMAVAYPDNVANYISAEGDQDGKYIYDLTPYMSDENIGFGTQEYLGDKTEYGKDDFVKAFIDEGESYTKNGMFSLPYMKSSECLYYNVEALLRAMTYYNPEIVSEDALQTYLSTMNWTEFMNLCASIKEHAKVVSSVLETPAYYDSDGNLFITKMFQNEIGYSSINPTTKKGVIDFESGENRTKAEAMVTALKKNYDDGLITTKGVVGTYGSDKFKNQQTVFNIGSSGGAGYTMPSGDDFKVGVCKVPYDNDNPTYVSQGVTLTFLKNPKFTDEENDLKMKYAWQFAKYLTNPDTNVEMCIYGSEGYLPVRYSAYETDKYQEFLREGEIYADTARVLIDEINGSYFQSPIFSGSAELRDECGGIISQVLRGLKGVTPAFTDAINKVKTYL